MRIRFIQNEDWLDGGAYVTWAKRCNHIIMFTKCYLYEEVPSEVDADMLVVLGGFQNPDTTKDECPFFDNQKEKELINKYISANKIVLGSCLGSQLIGSALGAKHEHSPSVEVGYTMGYLTEEGKKDKFFKDFPDKFNIGGWHYDMPGLTKDAKVLMYSEGCPRQIIRYSKYVYGFQTHMEFDKTTLLSGINHSRNTMLNIKGKHIRTIEELLSFDTSEMNNALYSFLDKIVEDYSK